MAVSKKDPTVARTSGASRPTASDSTSAISTKTTPTSQRSHGGQGTLIDRVAERTVVGLDLDGAGEVAHTPTPQRTRLGSGKTGASASFNPTFA